MAKKSEGQRLVRAAVKAGEVGAAVAAGGPGLLAVPSALLGVVAEVGEVIREENDRRVAELLREAFFENGSDEGIAAYIRGLLQEPAFRRVLREAVRSKLESLASEEVTPALGVLMREYELGREPDWFFRGACRVLQDLSPDEFTELQRLVDALVDASACVPPDTKSLVVNVLGAQPIVRVVVGHGAPNMETMGYDALRDLPASGHDRRLVRLLATHGLGTLSSRDELLSWRIECAVLVRLKNIVSPRPARAQPSST